MTRRRLTSILLGIAVAIVFLAACSSEPPVTEGTVVRKEFSPAHWEGGWETRYEYRCGYGTDYDGKMKYRCRNESVSYWDDQHIWQADQWRIRLRSCETGTTTDKPKCREGWQYVDQQTFDDYNAGQHYPRTKENV